MCASWRGEVARLTPLVQYRSGKSVLVGEVYVPSLRLGGEVARLTLLV